MKVLVTGANGFIGKHVTRALDKAGHEVLTYDLDKTENFQSLHLYAIEEKSLRNEQRSLSFCFFSFLLLQSSQKALFFHFFSFYHLAE